jgi:hypothetical protein
MKAYLDIETDRYGTISVIGVYTEHKGFKQFYGNNITLSNLERSFMGIQTIVTFNGDGFDLPVIKRSFNIDLKETYYSLDLFKVKRRLGIKGGLKELERLFGIQRKTVGVNGYKAIKLWESYINSRNLDALKLLLEYNKEDVINLIRLESCLEGLAF